MAKYTALLLLFFWTGVLSAQNQKLECGEDCKKKKFAYRFCDGAGGSFFLCSDDPNNEPGLKPYKQRLPLRACGINLDLFGVEDNYKRVFYPMPTPLNPIPGPILFNIDNVKMRLEGALASWNSLCPPQGPNDEHQDCCLPVMWAIRPEHMGESPNAFAFTLIRAVPYTGQPKDHKCLFDCSESRMVLNRLTEFIQPDQNGFPRNYYVTERENFRELPIFERRDLVWVDMQSLLEHELGHWLGFHHADEPDLFGKMCPPQSSIMLSGNSGHLNNRIVTLSDDDRCMFMKLYCCKETQRIVWIDDPTTDPDPHPDHTKQVVNGAERHTDKSYNAGFTVAPNPTTTGNITLSLYGQIDPSNTELRVVDGVGRVVRRQHLPEVIQQEITIDVHELPTGMYMLQIVQHGSVFGRKFIVSE